MRIGQKLMPLPLISAPMATSIAQAGSSSEMKASDSPNASAPTMGAAQNSWATDEFDHRLRVFFEHGPFYPEPARLRRYSGTW